MKNKEIYSQNMALVAITTIQKQGEE